MKLSEILNGISDLKGKTIKEAEKILKENNLKIELDENETDKEKIITKQIPEKEILVDEETSIIVILLQIFFRLLVLPHHLLG